MQPASARALGLVALLLLSTTLAVVSPTAGAESALDIEVLDTKVNPANNHTYHLLSASSWTEAAQAARGLEGFLVTVDDEAENSWLHTTWGNDGNVTRHLWTGLNDAGEEGVFRWHDGTPFLHRQWGEDQPSMTDVEDYVHITGPNMGSLEPGEWNDLENDPQYFPVYGVVEIGPGADFALRFDGDDDHVITDDDTSLTEPATEGELTIEARINPADLDGIHTVVMYGDHGYGLYLDDGRLGYASEYSLSKNPLSDANVSVQTDAWSTVAVAVNASTGGTFFLNGQAIGTFDATQAEIPAGDFGSNDCYEAGLACQNLVIGRHGAGADRYHFHGMIDHVSIAASDLRSTSSDGNITLLERTDAMSTWTFGEGEGHQTMDNDNRSANVHGAAWVMPDGSVVAQAMELENGEELMLDDISAGDTLLFFSELPQYTRDMTLQAFGWSSGNGKEEGDAEFSLYHDVDRVPSAWSHMDEVENWGWGGVFASYSWPDAGVHWFAMQAEADIDEFTLWIDWEVAEAPPTLDDMIELKHGIPVADQELQSQRGSEFGDSVQYFVNVTEPLADLAVETYGGNGNVDLAISYGGPPDPFGQWSEWDEWDIIGAPGLFGDDTDAEAYEDWSAGPGNEEEVHLYNLQPGIYYITAFTWGRAFEYSIVADLTPMPTNGEASDAIALTAGVPYGPFSGYDGLSQYFSIDVPDGTERLEVSLDDGLGEADLHLAYESTPTETVYDERSAAPGANDKVAFNDPTPGTWMILVHTDRVFSGTTILAEFTDRYVWDWDGEPIQLLNGEAIVGIEAEEGTVLEFFGLLEEPASPLEVNTWGDEGSIELEGEAEPYDWDMIFEDGPRGRQWGEQSWSEGDGVAWTWYVDTAANGRFDVTVEVVDDITGFGIIATWFEADLPPVDDDDDDDVDEPFDPAGCEERALDWFEGLDTNRDGLVTVDEHRPHPSTGTPAADVDVNGDERIQMEEVEADLCTCGVEFMFIWEQAEDAGATTVEDLEEVDYLNEIDVEAIDRDGDGDIDGGEAERHTLACTTTYDPLDLDGDGVPNDDDAFPEDPDESLDSDGDGVGDNADLVSGVNDSMVTYGAAAAVLVLIIVLLLTMLRRGPGGPPVDPWAESGDEKRMPELFDNTLSAAEPLPATTEPKPSSATVDQTVGPHVPEMMDLPSMTDLPPSLDDARSGAPLEWR